jgi:hypothetical protein
VDPWWTRREPHGSLRLAKRASAGRASVIIGELAQRKLADMGENMSVEDLAVALPRRRLQVGVHVDAPPPALNSERVLLRGDEASGSAESPEPPQLGLEQLSVALEREHAAAMAAALLASAPPRRARACDRVCVVTP